MPLLDGVGISPTPGPGKALVGLLAVHGPTVFVVVGHWESEKNEPSMDQALPRKGVPAPIDTGAGECCIDDTLAKELRLPVVDRVNLGGVAGTQPHDVYLGYVEVPKLGVRSFGKFAGVHMQASGTFQRVLIGRTLLAGMILIYHGPAGAFTLAR